MPPLRFLCNRLKVIASDSAKMLYTAVVKASGQDRGYPTAADSSSSHALASRIYFSVLSPKQGLSGPIGS